MNAISNVEITIVGGVTPSDMDEIRLNLPQELQNNLTLSDESLGAIDLPIIISLVVSFTFSAVVGGMLYDLLKNAVVSLLQYRDNTKGSKEVVIEIRSPKGTLHISEFEVYVSLEGQDERKVCSIKDGLVEILIQKKSGD